MTDECYVYDSSFFRFLKKLFVSYDLMTTGSAGIALNIYACVFIGKRRMLDDFTKYYLISLCLALVGTISTDLFIRYKLIGDITDFIDCRLGSFHFTFDIASLLTLTAIPGHWFYSIKHTSPWKPINNRIIARLVIIGLWFISILCTWPLSTSMYKEDMFDECNIFGPKSQWFAYQVCFVILFIFQMVGCIGLIRHLRILNTKAIRTYDHGHASSLTLEWRKKMIFTLLGIYYIYFISRFFEYVTNIGYLYPSCDMNLMCKKITACDFFKLIFHVIYLLIPFGAIEISKRAVEVSQQFGLVPGNPDKRSLVVNELGESSVAS